MRSSFRDHKTLAAITPEEWAKRIWMLPEHLQAAVANIVWWDWIANRTGPHDAHLDRWINMRVPDVPNRELVTSLVAVGYSRQRAKGRVDSVMGTQKPKKWNWR